MINRRFFRWSWSLGLAALLAGVLSMLVPAAVGRAAEPAAANRRSGDLVVFHQDYAGMSGVPGNMCLASDSMEGTARNLTLVYDHAGRCVTLAAAAGASGKLLVGGLSPALLTAITLDMGMARTDGQAVINVYAGGAWLAIRLPGGASGDSLEMTSHYYGYNDNIRRSATSVARDAGPVGGGRFEITIASDCHRKTNTIYLNGEARLTTPYTRYYPYGMSTVYDPFVNPFVHFDFASVASGQSAQLRLYSIRQTVPEYSHVTPVPDPGRISFGVDLHPWKTVKGGLSLLDGGTIWADVEALRSYSSSDLAALKALVAGGFELGIHYSQRLIDLPLNSALRLMDDETAQIKAVFGQSPTSWSSLQGADNATHLVYAYTKLGMVSRNGPNGSGGGLSSIANLGDNCWPFWGKASAAGVVVPSFTHQMDVTPAITWSISPANFRAYVSNYAANGVRIVGFREYWDVAQNSYHTDISNIASDPGASLSFTVRNQGGKSRLLVNAPWAASVRDRSGRRVPFQVSGAGILMEVEDGDYEVAAGPAPRAGFSADRTVAVVGQAVQFTDLSTGGSAPLSYWWDFGDGTGSTLRSPSHTYNSAGSFTVALRVTDKAGATQTGTRAGYITVNQPPSVTPDPAGPGPGPVPSGPTGVASDGAPLIADLTAGGGRPGEVLTVTITGTGFDGATGVSFGPGIAVGEFRVSSDTELTAVISIDGAAGAGRRDVTVTTPRGCGTIVGGFSVYQPEGRAYLWAGPASAVGGLVWLGLLAALALRLRRRRAKPAPVPEAAPPPE